MKGSLHQFLLDPNPRPSFLAPLSGDAQKYTFPIHGRIARMPERLMSAGALLHDRNFLGCSGTSDSRLGRQRRGSIAVADSSLSELAGARISTADLRLVVTGPTQPSWPIHTLVPTMPANHDETPFAITPPCPCNVYMYSIGGQGKPSRKVGEKD